MEKGTEDRKEKIEKEKRNYTQRYYMAVIRFSRAVDLVLVFFSFKVKREGVFELLFIKGR